MSSAQVTPARPPALDFAALVEARGYVLLYRRDASNHCPGCGHSQWLVGRMTAECAHCGTALPLMSPLATETTPQPIGKD